MATSKLVKTNEKIAEALTEVFFNIEHSVVDRYTKIEDTFVETYLAKKRRNNSRSQRTAAAGTGTAETGTAGRLMNSVFNGAFQFMLKNVYRSCSDQNPA